MKRILALILVLTVCLTFGACKGKNGNTEPTEKSSEATEATQTESMQESTESTQDSTESTQDSTQSTQDSTESSTPDDAPPAVYESNYPYNQWTLTEATRNMGYSKSRGGYQWNTLYGTVNAPELKSGELRYNVYLPTKLDPNKEYPMVVYLHGSTTSYKQDNDGLTPWSVCINNKTHKMGDEMLKVMGDCIIFAPQIPGAVSAFAEGEAWSNMTSDNWRRSTIDQTGSSYYLKAVEKKMAEFIEYGVQLDDKTFAVNMQRVYLCGDSMGAIGAYAMLADCPTTFAGVTIRAGIGDPDKAYLWKDTPVRIIHGDQDKNVPYAASTVMIEALQAVGAKDAERITIVGGAHNIMNVTYQTFDEEGNNVYLGWLAKQVRTDATLPGAS